MEETQALEVLEDRSLVFGTSEPDEIIKKATRIANALTPLIENKKLYIVIGRKKHVYVEGWNTMLAMLGVFPNMMKSLKLDWPDQTAYLARVELRHVSGAIVGAGEALCSSAEDNWKDKDEFQINSMAQTRATGKAARLSFSWIMNLAGYAETPAEEMAGPRAPEKEKPPIAEPQRKTPPPAPAQNLEQVEFIPISSLEKPDKNGHPRWSIKSPEGEWYATRDPEIGNLICQARERKQVLLVKYKRDGDFRNISTATIV